MGLNPLFPDARDLNGVQCAGTTLQNYNPYHYSKVTVRSEPAGTLFATTSDYYEKDSHVIVPNDDDYEADVYNTSFAYWATNGIPIRDEWGMTKTSFEFVMPDHDVEVVAYTIANKLERLLFHWFGHTNVALTSDTDGDGHTLAWEFTMGGNPLFSDTELAGISYGETALINYDVDATPVYPYILRSEPEGALFASSSNNVAVGNLITTRTFSPTNSLFAYWKCNGKRVCDEWGRALDRITTNMPPEKLELVAVASDDFSVRQALYWYGVTNISLFSDTDGDGATLAWEISMGTNPLYPDNGIAGVVGWNGVVHRSSPRLSKA